MQIEIFADIVCPWCWIGRRRLEQALAMRPQIKAQIIWRAFLLNPSLPDEGMDRQAYLNAKFGHASSAIYGRIQATGAETGLSFNFDRIKRQPDSRPVQKLILAAALKGQDVTEAFYQAYFRDGLDIADSSVRQEICAAAGLPQLATDPAMQLAAEQLRTDLTEGQNHRIEGVPFFVLNGKLALSGAHPPEVLLNALDAAERPL